MRVLIAATALLIATASASSPSLRGQEMAELDDMEVDASVLMARTEAEFEGGHRRLDTGMKMYRASFSTPVDSKSTMVVRGKCVQWVQKPNQFKAIIPPGYEAENANVPKTFQNSKTETFSNFDFQKLCSKGERETGDAAGECAEMYDAVRTLGTAALGKARFCALPEALPCVVPSMDDVAIRIITPTQPFADPDADYKVKSVAFDNCSMKIDFASPSHRPSAWSTVEITALFPAPSTAGTAGGR